MILVHFLQISTLGKNLIRNRNCQYSVTLHFTKLNARLKRHIRIGTAK